MLASAGRSLCNASDNATYFSISPGARIPRRARAAGSRGRSVRAALVCRGRVGRCGADCVWEAADPASHTGLLQAPACPCDNVWTLMVPLSMLSGILSGGSVTRAVRPRTVNASLATSIVRTAVELFAWKNPTRKPVIALPLSAGCVVNSSGTSNSSTMGSRGSAAFCADAERVLGADGAPVCALALVWVSPPAAAAAAGRRTAKPGRCFSRRASECSVT